MFVPTLRTAALALVVALLPGCELIASFDRDEIPEPGFMVPDAMTIPRDGAVIEGGLPETDGSTDAGDDAGPPDMDASVDAGETDAGDDMDATIDSGDDIDSGM
jgi:hypothetical protein